VVFVCIFGYSGSYLQVAYGTDDRRLLLDCASYAATRANSEGSCFSGQALHGGKIQSNSYVIIPIYFAKSTEVAFIEWKSNIFEEKSPSFWIP